MPIDSDIHNELAGFYDEVIAVLDSADFFNIEGEYNPTEVYASIPKRDIEAYKEASEKKNSRVWDILKAVLIGGAIAAGVGQIRKDYPKQVAAYETKSYIRPEKYPKPRTVKEIADEYMEKRGGELIKNMNRTDQKKLVAYIWSNAQRNERPLARQIKNEPHIQSILDTGKHRTETIVRQERQRAINYASTVHAKEIGAKTRTRMEKQDLRTRPSHKVLRGETVPIDKPYSNGEMYPNQIDINCRGSQLFDF